MFELSDFTPTWQRRAWQTARGIIRDLEAQGITFDTAMMEDVTERTAEAAAGLPTQDRYGDWKPVKMADGSRVSGCDASYEWQALVEEMVAVLWHEKETAA